jgi:hypothetical protein
VFKRIIRVDAEYFLPLMSGFFAAPQMAVARRVPATPVPMNAADVLIVPTGVV